MASLKVIACIQARMDSTRLPGKVLLPIAGKTSIEWIVTRLANAKEIDQVMLATSADPANDRLVAEAERLGIAWHREADESDLVSRFLHCCQKFSANAFVRVTADCPLVDPELVDSLIRIWRDASDAFDAVTNVVPPTFPDGMDLDVIPVATLERLDHDIPNGDVHREWMTPYLYAEKNGFRIRRVTSPRDLSGYRITLDYPEDVVLITKVFEYFGDRVSSLDEIIAYLDAHPDVRDLVNAHIDITIVKTAPIRSGAYQSLIDRHESV